MTRQDEKKGAFAADIPAEAVEEALRAVEKTRAVEGEPGGDSAPAEEAPLEIPEGATVESLAAELASVRAQLELSQLKARETLEKLRDEHDRVLRAAADLDNTRKRGQREREELQKFANEQLVKDLLPGIDNLDRALAAAPPDDPLADGVRLVKRTFEDALARHDVKVFSALGELFDPRLHEALLQVPGGDAPPGTVVLEHGRGFFLHDRLIRPAMVGVAVAAPVGSKSAGKPE
jgi:molecular chaperone GrpE